MNAIGRRGILLALAEHLGQQGKPCPRCRRPIGREQFMNRGSHFLPFCQRLR
ncbi:zinc finger domain-containing protein [Salinibacterium sp. ZJ450]|uniref:zinc finger domain-containing protein n=1 Tax=Salinibacterium sp. ZJ450 TaxID=2708338 RepID=UPI00351D2F71